MAACPFGRFLPSQRGCTTGVLAAVRRCLPQSGKLLGSGSRRFRRSPDRGRAGRYPDAAAVLAAAAPVRACPDRHCGIGPASACHLERQFSWAEWGRLIVASVYRAFRSTPWVLAGSPDSRETSPMFIFASLFGGGGGNQPGFTCRMTWLFLHRGPDAAQAKGVAQHEYR